MTVTDWISEPVNWFFTAIGLMVLFAGLRVVTAKNVVHSALYLVGALGGTAGLFVLLSAEFVAWVLVLVYIGAVIVQRTVMGITFEISAWTTLFSILAGYPVAYLLATSSERTRTVQGNSLPVIELQSDQRLAKPAIRLAPRLSCALHEGCARL